MTLYNMCFMLFSVCVESVPPWRIALSTLHLWQFIRDGAELLGYNRGAYRRLLLEILQVRLDKL